MTAENQRDPTMQAIARLSRTQAVALAVAWPVLLVALPYAIALVRRAIVMTTAPRGNGFQPIVGFHMRVASWPALIAVLAVPPIVFLYAWWTAKRT
jgi:hypothetical protein